ncbi:MAG TPA: glycosyltransferase family 4 protein, partial [Acidimicrobiales bacterium]
ADGLNQPLDREIQVEPAAVSPPPAAEEFDLMGDLDEPTDGSVVPGPLVTVRGWSVLDPVAYIEVTVDGEASFARQMALPRPDVALHLASPHAGFCGFEHVVDLTDRSSGAHVHITVEGVDADGSHQLIGTSTVTVGPAEDRPADPVDDGYLAVLRARTDAVTSRHRPATDGIRLLVVTHDLGLGGGQLYLQELLLRLLDQPDLRALVVSPTDGPLRPELEARGVEVHLAGHPPTEPAANESYLRGLAYLAAEFATTAVLANTTGAAGGVTLAERLGVPALWAIHESYAPEHFLLAAHGPGGAHPAAAERLDGALSSAAAVIFEADGTRELYCSHGDARRFVTIDYGIAVGTVDEFQATDDRDARRRALGWGPDDVVLLCVGTLEPRKAQASLLRAFARVAPDHPEAVLVLVGDRGDPYGDEVRAYAGRLGLDDRVRVEPVTPDCYAWYAAADAFVLNSDVESLPRSALEAMAFGLPAIVADVFGLGELVDDGVTGFHVTPRDLASLEGGLRRLLRLDGPERRAMGARAAAHIGAEHDSHGYATAYRRLLDGLAADPTAFPGAILD